MFYFQRTTLFQYDTFTTLRLVLKTHDRKLYDTQKMYRHCEGSMAICKDFTGEEQIASLQRNDGMFWTFAALSIQFVTFHKALAQKET